VLSALLIRWVVLAAAFAVTTWLVSGVDVSGGVLGYVWVSAVFGIVNAIIGTILRILTFPLKVLTLGLFSVVVNALLLEITDALTSHLSIDEFWWSSILAAVILSMAALILDLVLRRVLGPIR